ncbi:hypothetical protein SCARD494_03989 [Seiridium cardinale]
MNHPSMAMEIDAPTGKRSRSRSPDKTDLTRKKTAREETVKAPPILLTTEMMLDKSADRPATPNGATAKSSWLDSDGVALRVLATDGGENGEHETGPGILGAVRPRQQWSRQLLPAANAASSG